MSCSCGKHEDCQCDHDTEQQESHLTPAQKEMLDKIEFVVGYAININMTNFYKRDLMKSVVDEYALDLEDRLNEDFVDEKAVKEDWKKEVLEQIDKIAKASDGYSAVKEYVSIMADLI